MNLIEKQKILLETISAYLYNEKQTRCFSVDDALQQSRLRKVLQAEILLLLEEKDLRDILVVQKENEVLYLLQKAQFYEPFVKILEEHEMERSFLLESVLKDRTDFFSFLSFANNQKERIQPLLISLKDHKKTKEFAFDSLLKKGTNEKEDIQSLKSLLDLDLLNLGTWREKNKHDQWIPAISFSFSSLKIQLGMMLYQHPSFQNAPSAFQEEANQYILSKLALRGFHSLQPFLSLEGFYPNSKTIEIIQNRYDDTSNLDPERKEEMTAIKNLLEQRIIEDTKHSKEEKAERILQLEQVFQTKNQKSSLQKQHKIEVHFSSK